MCSSRKYPITNPMDGHWKFQGTWGIKSQNFKGKYEAKLNFRRGVGWGDMQESGI